MNMILIVTIALSKPWRPPWSERGTASILYYTILYYTIYITTAFGSPTKVEGGHKDKHIYSP